jgi:hypothetical protein
MSYLFALLIGCLPPLAYKNYAGSNFETTRSPCVDSLYVNLDNSKCDDALIFDFPHNNYFLVRCIDQDPGIIDNWTIHAFYITSRYNTETWAAFMMDESYTWFCSDQQMVVYTKPRK